MLKSAVSLSCQRNSHHTHEQVSSFTAVATSLAIQPKSTLEQREYELAQRAENTLTHEALST